MSPIIGASIEPLATWSHGKLICDSLPTPQFSLPSYIFLFAASVYSSSSTAVQSNSLTFSLHWSRPVSIISSTLSTLFAWACTVSLMLSKLVMPFFFSLSTISELVGVCLFSYRYCHCLSVCVCVWVAGERNWKKAIGRHKQRQTGEIGYNSSVWLWAIGFARLGCTTAWDDEEKSNAGRRPQLGTEEREREKKACVLPHSLLLFLPSQYFCFIIRFVFVQRLLCLIE